MIIASPEKMRDCGHAFASHLQPGDVIALVGDLGSGKTTFVQGLAQALQVAESAYVRSPTFTIINEYAGRIPLFHIDLYRLERPEELAGLGLEDYFDAGGITVVEWADKFRALFPPRTKWITFRTIDERTRAVEGIKSC